MVIGDGLIARAFMPFLASHNDVIVFASGVSNSREARAEPFERERLLLLQTLALGKRTLYFSTCSVYDPELRHSVYVQHKVAMEQLLLAGGTHNLVFRLPQVVGHSGNPNTLTNYLQHQISTDQTLQVWCKAKRNLIDVTDVAAIACWFVERTLPDDRIINIACPFSVSILDLVKVFEVVLKKKANYVLVDAGGDYHIDTQLAQQAASELGLDFGDNYVDHLIRKYYA